MRKASYKKLWKILIDKDLNKKILAQRSGVSPSTLTKMTKGEKVNVDVLIRICDFLECELQDILELVPVTEPNDEVDE